MQTTGYIIDRRTGEKIKVLVRQGRKLDKWCYEIHLKLRNSGQDGSHLTGEEEHLNDDYEIFDNLKSGAVVGL